MIAVLTRGFVLVAGLFLALGWPLCAISVGFEGNVSGSWRYFPVSADPLQTEYELSLTAAPRVLHEWDDSRQQFTFAPFAHLYLRDEESSHVDVRDLSVQWMRPAWELRVGIRQVFWGVTESQHLVDIINQMDLVENPDGEEKLGQPMLNLALISDAGTLDLFVLPYFRERTFPGVEGRLRLQPRPLTDQALYESEDEEYHTDYALRWYRSVGVWDIGASYFDGTTREPLLLPVVTGAGESVLLPYYPLIEQTGLDVQATIGAWLLKLEAIRRTGFVQPYYAAIPGFEYTVSGILESPADLGLLFEYLYDERGDEATTPFEDDTMLGLRLSLNDAQSTSVLLAAIIDNSDRAVAYSLEASRRLSDQWKLLVEARAFEHTQPDDLLHFFRRDDYLQIDIAYYF